ncbi:MAG TPA: UvrB/UvrC motif-containing protein [bacterium]|nr:UvrB/UvrC motif-containing protein [bacterium]HPQ65933.1 UvrB/UvrC motif-containing protein [bacterium]
MLCANCKKNEATVHLTEIEGNQIVKVHLCPACAQHKGVATPVVEALKNLPEDISKQRGSEETGEVCSVCGLSFKEFREVGRLGCPNCYRDLGRPLRELLAFIHKGPRHAGKVPDAGRRERHRLRQALDAAVAREDYEEASRIRDLLERDSTGAGDTG